MKEDRRFPGRQSGDRVVRTDTIQLPLQTGIRVWGMVGLVAGDQQQHDREQPVFFDGAQARVRHRDSAASERSGARAARFQAAVARRLGRHHEPVHLAASRGARAAAAGPRLACCADRRERGNLEGGRLAVLRLHALSHLLERPTLLIFPSFSFIVLFFGSSLLCCSFVCWNVFYISQEFGACRQSATAKAPQALAWSAWLPAALGGKPPNPQYQFGFLSYG